MKRLDPGRMSARLVLEGRADVSDGQGGATLGFAPVAAVWAQVEPLALTAEERVGEAVLSITHRIWIRFRGDVAAGMRFRKDERVFAIRGFHDPDETRRYLVCRCEEDGR